MALAYPDPPLGSPAVHLRRWRDDDVDELVRCCNDAAVRRWLTPIPVPYTRGDAAEFIRLAQDESGVQLRFAIALDGDRLGGAIGLRMVAPGIAQTGYWVAAESRGRGVATAALRLVARWAVGLPDVARLQLFTDVDNAASMRVAERAGFRREGVLRNWYDLRGERRDAAMYAVLPGDGP